MAATQSCAAGLGGARQPSCRSKGAGGGLQSRRTAEPPASWRSVSATSKPRSQTAPFAKQCCPSWDPI